MFHGRYGMDRLNRAISFATIPLLILSFLIRNPYINSAISGLVFVLLIISIYRMFSRNFSARQKELHQYTMFAGKFRAWGMRVRNKFQNRTNEIKDRKHFKLLNCPQCMQRLRVPRGKGRLRVTCTRCGNKFETKS